MGVSKRVTKGEGPTLQFLSHKGPEEPVPSEFNPQKVFDKLFGSFTPKDDPSGKLRGDALSAVLEDAKRLRQRVGAADQKRLDAHLSSVASLQKQILAAPPACKVPTKPGETNTDDAEHHEPLESVSKTMADLIALAFACDITRVVSFQQSGSVGGTIYSAVGATVEEHGLTHDPNQQELVHKTVVFNIKCFAYLLESLKAQLEGEGNVLDNSCILLGSDCAEGLTHSSFDQPIIVAGRGGLVLPYPGIHYRSSSKENTSDVLLSCLRTVDPTATEVGKDQGYSNKPCSALKV